MDLTRRDFLRSAAVVGLAGLVTPPGPAAAAGALVVGARVNDVSWSTANAQVGPLKVTRLYYPGGLPSSFSRQGIPAGVRLIVSYKARSANTAGYARSIPADSDVELCLHHEPEGPTDFPGDPAVAGPRYVADFKAEQAIIAVANPAIPMVFIGGGYQYTGGRSSSRGIGGYFIPSTARYFYMDSYQPTQIVAASQSPSVRNFIAELGTKGARFNGITEYGRGMSTNSQPIPSATVQARILVFSTDNAWLRSMPDARVWSYWYANDPAGRHWRLTDSASQAAWRKVTAQ